jgi:hypothetical protein
MGWNLFYQNVVTQLITWQNLIAAVLNMIQFLWILKLLFFLFQWEGLHLYCFHMCCFTGELHGMWD